MNKCLLDELWNKFLQRSTEIIRLMSVAGCASYGHKTKDEIWEGNFICVYWVIRNVRYIWLTN
jgi:hypothetical protein